MAHASLGVIGHVDHGKTALVKALTGIDTDRLEEEQRRGMSIVLGFAHLQLEGGVLDLVDVPGHEQFVRAMVAGATGIHATLLAVDAREGIKPQTAEHVAIADLLGLRRGVVAVTKSDLVDEVRRSAVQRELRGFLRGTHLEFAPLVFTSAATGEGLPALRQALAALLQHAPPPGAAAAHCYLPVDRVFTLPGHGTVATGTLRGGMLRVGDALAAMPRGQAGSVRQLQVHKRIVETAWPGQRVGVNLRHLKPGELARGDVLAPAGRLRAGVLLDVQLRLLHGEPEQLEGERLRLLFGTTEVGAVLRVLGQAGAGARLAQLRTTGPVVAVTGEPFILRRASPPQTLGGGRILDPSPERHARSDAAAVRRLQVLAGGSAQQLLCERLRAAGTGGLPIADLLAESRLQEPELMRAVEGVALRHAARLWHLPLVQALEDRVIDGLRAYHRTHPLRPAAPLSVCRSALPAEVGEALCRELLGRLQRDGRLLLRQATAALPDHDPLQALQPARRAELSALAAAFRAGGVQPPDPPGPGDAQRRPLLDLLVALGDVLLLPGQPPTQRIAFHRDAVVAARARLQAAFPAPQPFTVSQARELLGSTRKFTVPLLEHLLATGQTRRRGDQHVFRDPPSTGGV